jgi:hypothetical protein
MKSSTVALITAVTLGLASNAALAARCKHKADREATFPAADVQTVEIFALAGELRVRGDVDATEIVAKGDACVSREGMLEGTGITMRELPDRLQVLVELPDTREESDSEWEGELAIMDLSIALPDSVAVIVHDSSGGIQLNNLASLELSDSSGDIEIEQVAGPVLIPRDSSGDIDMRGVGAVTIQVDSSGEIFIDGADSVTIANDTSGDIMLRRISGNVLIGNDSSGTISVRDVGGSFIVENDTSGGINYREVAGNVSLPENRQGG